MAGQGLGRVEEVIELSHAQQSGAPKRGVIGRIGARKRTGVRKRGFGARRTTPRLDDDDWLGPGSAPGRRHKLRRVRDRFHVEQDGAA